MSEGKKDVSGRCHLMGNIVHKIWGPESDIVAEKKKSKGKKDGTSFTYR